MSERSRVIWSEGMFLRPQHFQQLDRYVASFVEGRTRGLIGYDWGFNELKLDRNQLRVGKIAISTCNGIFADGTPFDLPEHENLPLPLEIPDGIRNSVVYLALPLNRLDIPQADSDTSENLLARYHIVDTDIRDNIKGDGAPAPIQIGKLRLRLMLEQQERSGYVCLGIARVIEVRSDKTVILDDAYIPPTLNCFGGSILGDFIKELHGLLHTRGEALATRVAATGKSGVSEIADFLLLQLINRFEPLLQHLVSTAIIHPEPFFQLGLQITGELATFYRPEKRPVSFPAYQHDNLQYCFYPLMEELRQLLSLVLEQNAIQITLSKPKFGVYAARRPDLNLLDNAIFVLAASAQVPPDTLRTHFPPQVKIGPVEDIQQLVQAALPGIPIHPLPVAPRQLPYHAGFSYFELNKQSDLWKKMAQSGGFAIHIGGNFPELELEFWAIKKG